MDTSILKDNISKLKETFSNKDLLKYVTGEYKLSPNFPAAAVNEYLGDYLSDRALREAFGLEFSFYKKYAVDAIIRVYFLDHFRLVDSISLDILKVNSEHFKNLTSDNFDKFITALAKVFKKDGEMGFNTSPSNLFSELYEIAWRVLGVEESLILMNDFIGLHYSKDFKRDSRSYIEIFLQGVEYFRTRDREYPLDWVISSDVLNERYLNT